MKSRVMEFLRTENLLFDTKFGFRNGLSTSDAILVFVDRCAVNLDDKLYTVAVFIDLSRAFLCNRRDKTVASFVPLSILRSVYLSLFHSTLSYCITVWGGCGATNIAKLNRIVL